MNNESNLKNEIMFFIGISLLGILGIILLVGVIEICTNIIENNGCN